MSRISVFSLVVIITISQPSSAKVREAKYTRGIRPSTTDLQPNLLGKYNVGTLTQCAAMCMYTARCMSFLYGKASPPDECYTTASHKQYTGKWNVTANGIPCQSFAEITPQNHTFTANDLYPDGSVEAAGNNCRDPDNSGYLWCYTLDENVRYEKCDIQRCTDDNLNCVLYDVAVEILLRRVDLGIVKYYLQ